MGLQDRDYYQNALNEKLRARAVHRPVFRGPHYRMGQYRIESGKPLVRSASRWWSWAAELGKGLILLVLICGGLVLMVRGLVAFMR